MVVLSKAERVSVLGSNFILSSHELFSTSSIGELNMFFSCNFECIFGMMLDRFPGSGTETSSKTISSGETHMDFVDYLDDLS